MEEYKDIKKFIKDLLNNVCVFYKKIKENINERKDFDELIKSKIPGFVQSFCMTIHGDNDFAGPQYIAIQVSPPQAPEYGSFWNYLVFADDARKVRTIGFSNSKACIDACKKASDWTDIVLPIDPTFQRFFGGKKEFVVFKKNCFNNNN